MLGVMLSVAISDLVGLSGGLNGVMPLCYTVALLLPGPLDRFAPLFYRLMTASTDEYVRVDPPEVRYPMNGRQIRVVFFYSVRVTGGLHWPRCAIRL
eukprot:7603674-Pyramimonas_sp.AAC.1